MAIGRDVTPHAPIDRGTLHTVCGLEFGSATDRPSGRCRGELLLLRHDALLTYLIVAVCSILLRIHMILLLRDVAHLWLFSIQCNSFNCLSSISFMIVYFCSRTFSEFGLPSYFLKRCLRLRAT